MTVETITALMHDRRMTEQMHVRLNDSNNSNDEREIKHVQERPDKRCGKKKEKTGISITKAKR